MLDSYLGQAGFGEQIRLYSESFWRQAAVTFVWVCIIVWLVLVAVAVVITLSRQAEADQEMDSARRLSDVLRTLHTGPLRPRVSKRRAGPPPDSSTRAA